MQYDHIEVPGDGEAITMNTDFTLNVPAHPIMPVIEGDGIGIDVTPVMKDVVDAAVSKAYGGERAHRLDGGLRRPEGRGTLPGALLPEETLHALRDYVVSIKGPLATPVGGGIRCLNVSIRQTLDLYACVRPIQYFPGVADADERLRPGVDGDLPREHRRHLRRHRMAGGLAGGARS